MFGLFFNIFDRTNAYDCLPDAGTLTHTSRRRREDVTSPAGLSPERGWVRAARASQFAGWADPEFTPVSLVRPQRAREWASVHSTRPPLCLSESCTTVHYFITLLGQPLRFPPVFSPHPTLHFCGLVGFADTCVFRVHLLHSVHLSLLLAVRGTRCTSSG